MITPINLPVRNILRLRRTISNVTLPKMNQPFESHKDIIPPASPKEDRSHGEDSRINQAYKILGSGSRFRWSAFRCSKLYKNRSTTFFEELQLTPDKGMIKYLNAVYPTSKSIRALLLNDALKMLLLGNHKGVIRLIQELKENVHPLQLETLDGLREEKHTLGDFLVLHTVLGGDYLMAVSYSMTLATNGIHISTNTMETLMRALIVDKSPNSLNYNSYTIFKVIEDFQAIDHDLLLQILKYMSCNKYIYFTNQFFTKLAKSEIFPELLEHQNFNDTLHEVILSNLQQGNSESALDLWSRYYTLTPGNNAQIDLITLLLNQSSPQSIELILSNLPDEVAYHPEILDLVLEHYGVHNQPKFNELVKRLSNPLRRSSVSALFKSFLHQKKQQYSEKMLELIFKSSTGLTPKDYQNIVLELLEQDNLSQCIDMLKTTDVNVLKLAYVSVLQQILKGSTPERLTQYHDFFKELQVKFLLLNEDDEAYGLFIRSIVQYLSLGVNNRLARSTYIKIGNRKSINFKRVGLIDDFNKLIGEMHMKGKIQCLEIISKQAMKEEDLSAIKWTIDEMRFLGLSVKEILSLLEKHDLGYLKKILRLK